MTKRTYLCPYCLKEHELEKVLFRCKNRRCKIYQDKELAMYSGKSVELKQLCFLPQKAGKKGMPMQAICPECGEITTTRICPSCHNNLPTTIDCHQEKVIAIIGARDSGKSSYMAVLIKELKKRVLSGFHGAMNFMDQESYEEYEERFGTYLYPVKPGAIPRILPQTKTSFVGNTSIGVNRPILCDIKLEKKSWLHDKMHPYTFVFYDAAGEDFDDEGVMFTISKYISEAAGILFLLDPLQIERIRMQLDASTVKKACTIEPRSVSPVEEIIDRVAKLIRAKRGILECEKIEIPVAVAFSKFDAIKNIVPSNSILLSRSPHVERGKFVKYDAALVNEEMIGLLHEWGEREFLNHLHLNYTTYAFFSCSAFGHSPDEEGRIGTLCPHRIEDPLLWIMMKNKMIESVGEE